MRLSSPPEKYDQLNEAQTRSSIEREDARNYKRGQDVELSSVQRLILADTVTGDRYSITMIAGVLTATAL